MKTFFSRRIYHFATLNRGVLFCLSLALVTFQAHAVILFSQPHDGSATLNQSSSWSPNGSDYDQFVWDRFALSTDQAVTAVNWRGGGTSSPIVDFEVAIYASIPAGTQPDLGYLYTGPLVSYTTSGAAGQTYAGTYGGVAMYDYHFALPSPFQVSAGVPYWIYIVANQSGLPGWGLANGGSGNHFRRIANVGDIFYQTVSGDVAFSLEGSDLPTVSIAASIAPASSGSIQGTGSYPVGSTVSLTAVPATNYGFVDWTEGGNSVSTSNPYSFTATTSRTLVANFTASYTITTSSLPLAGGTTSGGGIYNQGAGVTVIATPSAGYTFTSWLDGGSPVSVAASYTFTAQNTLNLVAQFTAQPASALFDFDTGTPSVVPTQTMPSTQTNAGLTASFTALDMGFYSIQNTIYGFVPGVFSGNFLYPSYPYGSIEISFSQPLTSLQIAFCTAEVSSEYDIASHVRITSYSGSISNPPIGSISGQGEWLTGPYPEGTVTYSSATPFNIVKIDVPPGQGYPVSGYLFIDNLIAQRAAPPPGNTITASASPTQGGFVTGSGVYTVGSQVTLEAIANNGYNFVNWTEGANTVSTSSIYIFNASANRTLVAHFAQVWMVATIAAPAIGGVTSGDGQYTAGANVIVSALPNPGYYFVNWTEGVVSVSSSADYSFTATGTRTLTANFELIQYTLTTTVQPSGSGTVTGGGSYTIGSSASIWAGANSGFVFQRWEQSGIHFSDWQSETVLMDSARTLTAIFAPAVTISTPSSTTDGVAYGAGDYASGQTVELHAVPHMGRAFLRWEENSSPVSDSSTYSFTASIPRLLTAVFEPDTLSATFDFDNSQPSLADGNPLPATQVSGGWSASFNAPSGSFAVQSETHIGWHLSRMAGHFLVPNSSPSVLYVKFDRPVNSVRLSFATLDFQKIISPSMASLSAWSDTGGTQLVGIVNATGVIKPGDLLPTGTLSLQANGIRLIRVDMPTQSSGTTELVIDNISVRSVPELWISYHPDLDPTSVTLSWLAPCSGYTLQTNTNPTSTVWQPIVEQVQTLNSQNRVTILLSGERGFYRLSHP